MTSVVVIGAGGHGRVLIAALRRLQIEPHACLDASPEKRGQTLLGVPIVGGDDELPTLGTPARIALVNGIGYVNQPTGRVAVWSRFRADYEFFGICDPTAFVEHDVILGHGTQILARAVVQTGTVIGDNTIVNTGAQVDHECRVGAHCHIAPGAVLCGEVRVGDSVLIGAGAVIRQGISIGEGARVAAGAVIVKDVVPHSLVAGIPARSIDAR